jgi:hypothetical protein
MIASMSLCRGILLGTVALTVLASAGPASRADILYLRDGSRHYGELIAQDRERVRFRVILPDGLSSIVQVFPAEQVQRVQPTGKPQAEPSPPRPEQAATAPTEDCEQMLREAFELLDDHRLDAALRALQTVVLAAPREELPAFDEQCRAARGAALDELLAGTRLARAGAGRVFQLRYATPYERPALGRLLVAEQDARLAQSHAGRTVAEWAADPNELDEWQPEFIGLVADLTRSAALISTRLRLDPTIRDDRPERVRLFHLRQALVRQAGQIMARPEYIARRDTDANDPAEAERRRLVQHPQATSGPAGPLLPELPDPWEADEPQPSPVRTEDP